MSASCSIPIPTRKAVASRPSSLSRRSAKALAIRVIGAGGMLLSHIVLARSLGVTGFGEYSQAVTWFQFLCVFGKLGLDNTSLRFVSVYETTGDIGKLRGFIRDSTRSSILASLIVMFSFIAVVFAFRESIGDQFADCLMIASLMIPLVSLRQIHEASLRGLGRMLESQISMAIWPLTMFAMASAIWVFSSSGISSPGATLIHLVTVGMVSALVYRFFLQSNSQLETETARETCRRQWTNTAFAFFMAELLIALKSRVCVAIAGAFLGRDSAGLYAAMERFADVSLLGSQSLGLVIAPQFAALFAAGRYTEVRRLMWQGQILCLAFTLPVAILVGCFGDHLFMLLGSGYREGWAVLVALLSAACIASLGGPAAYVLQMTGHERTMLVITGACAATNIILSLVLIRPMGILGMGIAQMVTGLVWAVGVRFSLVFHPAWQRGVADRILTVNVTDNKGTL